MAIAVPLNADAIRLINYQVGKDHTHVFSFRGKPIRQSEPTLGTRRSSGPASGLPLARIAAQVGKLARAERNAAVRTAEVNGCESRAIVRRLTRTSRPNTLAHPAPRPKSTARAPTPSRRTRHAKKRSSPCRLLFGVGAAYWPAANAMITGNPPRVCVRRRPPATSSKNYR